jgi:aspartyl-tRNA(Asn)/glutamyl-tRNA(Gln) amidotransferase subunit B
MTNLDDKKAYQIASNYITSDLAGLTKGEVGSVNIFEKIPVSNFSELMMLTANSELSSRATKDILKMMYDGESGTPSEIANKHGLLQKSDESALASIVDLVVEQNPLVVNEYKNGKTTALQFLVGQGMKLSKGSANPGILKSLIEKKLQ